MRCRALALLAAAASGLVAAGCGSDDKGSNGGSGGGGGSKPAEVGMQIILDKTSQLTLADSSDAKPAADAPKPAK